MMFRNKKTKLVWDIVDKEMLAMVKKDTENFEPVETKKGKGASKETPPTVEENEELNEEVNADGDVGTPEA